MVEDGPADLVEQGGAAFADAQAERGLGLGIAAQAGEQFHLAERGMGRGVLQRARAVDGIAARRKKGDHVGNVAAPEAAHQPGHNRPDQGGGQRLEERSHDVERRLHERVIRRQKILADGVDEVRLEQARDRLGILHAGLHEVLARGAAQVLAGFGLRVAQRDGRARGGRAEGLALELERL